MQKETVNIYKLKDQDYVNYICCFLILYLKMNTFKRAEFRIAYKIFCLIIDWNGSDKLGFINERVHSPLAALPGNSENLREARG